MAKARAASKPPCEPAHDDRWRIPDALWERIEALLPPRPPHRFGGHNPRVADRRAMDAIFFVLRTGCQWTGTPGGPGLAGRPSAFSVARVAHLRPSPLPRASLNGAIIADASSRASPV